MQLLLFGEQRLIPIFYGMLISLILEHLGYICPFFALGAHMRNQHVVFLELPLLLGLVGVQVVEPSLPALLGRSEELAARSDV